jgi:hypothetical protein
MYTIMTEQIQQTLLDELGLADLPQDKKEEILIKMTEVVLKRIFIETMENLSEDDREHYKQLVDTNATPDEIEKFLQEKISNYDQMVTTVLDTFKEEMKQ